MRQAENKLPEAVTHFVARHPDIVALLAGVAPAPAPAAGALDHQRDRFRTYAGERIEAARSAAASQAGQDFLARLRAS